MSSSTNEKAESQERSYELRSEKGPSIVGQIPPVLTRYGISIITIVMGIVVAIAYWMPYRIVNSGTAAVYPPIAEAPSPTVCHLKLNLGDARWQPSESSTTECITLILPSGATIEGVLTQVSPTRDLEGRHVAVADFGAAPIQIPDGETVDCTIVRSQGSVLGRIIGQILPI